MLRSHGDLTGLARVHVHSSNEGAGWAACSSTSRGSSCPPHCGHVPPAHPLSAGCSGLAPLVLGAAPAQCSPVQSEQGAPLSSAFRSSLFSCSHHWWKMGYTVRGKCKSAVILAIQCRPGRVHFVQVQDSLHLRAGGQREKKKNQFNLRFKSNR